MRLTRKQVKEALEQTPIEQVILGSVGAKEISLTPKQREFARQLALGESKAGAYRKSRTTRAKPETASKRGQELAANGAITAQVEAFKAAFEAQKYQTPAHLRALAIHELTKHALDSDCPPAQRIKALELIGKMTEEITNQFVAANHFPVGYGLGTIEATWRANEKSYFYEVENGLFRLAA